ncbi:putative protein OS=Streptomyces griseomycini OX=66895 GN=FHS37_000305 PE=4 SV=1 [Streptomyces griseomycini]|uniref:Uncharacterized protein n=1 Tax=Streptomyces griseomycini TaxID=66895 RepID=A0A7W7LTQ6_9ACTN|nr:hypothetical protein [Streptomyces griseomycini]
MISSTLRTWYGTAPLALCASEAAITPSLVAVPSLITRWLPGGAPP